MRPVLLLIALLLVTTVADPAQERRRPPYSGEYALGEPVETDLGTMVSFTLRLQNDGLGDVIGGTVSLHESSDPQPVYHQFQRVNIPWHGHTVLRGTVLVPAAEYAAIEAGSHPAIQVDHRTPDQAIRAWIELVRIETADQIR